MANMPSGRDIHTTSPYSPPCLDADILASMRAPPEPSEVVRAAEDDESSGDESTENRSQIPGAFPGQPSADPNGGNYY